MTIEQKNKKTEPNKLFTVFETRKAFLVDLLQLGQGTIYENQKHLEMATAWLATAQDVTADGGVSSLYSIHKGWDLSYPETTGYIIPTFLNYAKTSGQSEWRERAVQMANWLLSIQLDSGGWPYRSGLAEPVVFDTGQIVFGLVSAFRETSSQKYLDSALKAARWLASILEPTGAWLKYTYNGFSTAYHTRVSWSLLEVYKETNHEELITAAKKNLDWALRQQLKNGWFENNGFSKNTVPSLHTIAYAARGLLECGKFLQNSDYLLASSKTGESLLNIQMKYGVLYGEYDQNWQPTSIWSCLTGNLQTAIIWLKLYQLNGTKSYLTAAKDAISFVKKTQIFKSKNPGIRGGIKGSHPINGGYMAYAYPNWAIKFFIDAILLEEEILQNPNPIQEGYETDNEYPG
jgi:hypothetical protein